MTGHSTRPRVLVCDDQPQILRALRVILRDAGFEAVPASDGEEALDLAAVGPLDAAIIDLVLMPMTPPAPLPQRPRGEIRRQTFQGSRMMTSALSR